MIFNNLVVLVFYCKLQLIQNILTNILYPPPPPSVKIYKILKKRQEEKVEELQLAGNLFSFRSMHMVKL